MVLWYYPKKRRVLQKKKGGDYMRNCAETRGRPRKPDDIAKRQLITIKASLPELERWKRAVACYGAAQCLRIALDALDAAVRADSDVQIRLEPTYLDTIETTHELQNLKSVDTARKSAI